MKIFIIIISILFGIGASISIAWVPLLIYNVFYYKSFHSYFKCFLKFCAPIVNIIIAIDSIYYKKMTFIAYNNALNIIKEGNLIKYSNAYLTHILPSSINILMILFVLGFGQVIYDSHKNRIFP
jgi:hypothetical protein